MDRWFNSKFPKLVPLIFSKLLDLSNRSNVAGNHQLDPTVSKRKKRDTREMDLFRLGDINNFKAATTTWTNSFLTKSKDQSAVVLSSVIH